MRTQLLTPVIEAVPGEPVAVRVEVVNTSTVIDEVVLDAPDLDPQWVAGDDRRAALFPDATVELEAHIDLPAAEFPAGEHEVELVVGSSTSPDDAARLVARVRYPATGNAELALRPALVNGGSKARFRAEIANHSNRTLQLTLDARDAVRALTFSIEPRHLTVEPNSTAEAVVLAVGRRAWLGSPTTRAITIEAEGAPDDLKAVATFNQKARIPQGALTAATLALIMLVWVGAFTFGVGRVLDAEATGKHAPDVFPLAQTSLDLDAVSGSIVGTVTAETTGGPLSRVVVEAYRNGEDGPEITASAATDADGTFELIGLLPGNYLLKASAPGFEPSWSGGADAPSDATATKVEPSAESGGSDLVVEGDPGSVQGRLLVGQVTGSETAASAVLIPVTAGIRREPMARVDVAEDGSFTIGSVPTPGDYELVVSVEGFEDRVVPVTLRGGEDTVLNTIALAADPGSLGGLVTNGGQPLGGVSVSISSGETEAETTTLTSGDVGRWVVPDLPTPGTYLITFALEGHRTEVVAVDLTAGQSRLDVNVTVAGGAGLIEGLVRDQASTPLAGVDVTVEGASIDAATRTLTDGAIGSWQLVALPTPGRYTITFSLAGFSTERRVVDLGAGESVSGLEIALAKVDGSLKGTVRSAGTPMGGATITVGDGSTVLTTTSATEPAGRWSIEGLAPGAYTVTVNAGGPDHTVLVDLGVGQDRVVDIDLP